MKVTCQSCQAKYTIADEKVRGKVAKIRCKKCGTTIIVNGSDEAGAASADAQAGALVADYTSQGSGEDTWTILVADGDQRTATAAEVSDLYVSGTITMETSAWKDGMPEWLPISQIDALRSVLENGPRPTMTPVEQIPSDRVSGASAKNTGPLAARARTPEPAAARRTGRGGAVDMFGAAHDDVMTSASGNLTPHAGHGGEDKMTGARNENSVLFSLSALTGDGGKGGGGRQASKDEPASSKADLRALMGMGSSDTNGRAPAAPSKLDDIMNLGGGGVYSPALMAPALAPPPVDFSSPATEGASGESKGKNKTVILVAVGAVVVAGVAAIAFSLGGSSKVEGDKAAPSATAASTGAPLAANATGAAPTPPAATPAPAETAAPTPAVATATAAPTAEPAPTVLSPGQAAPKSEPEKKPTPKAEKPAPAPAPEPKPVAAPPPEPKPAPVAAAPAAGGSGDFDRASALTALSAAASSAQSCKKADGPTGSGRIAVTFANNGAATTATVEGPPFAGTPVGGCVAARFRGAHVPPFGGSPVTVHKSFNIN